jgi:hypothetical protein
MKVRVKEGFTGFIHGQLWPEGSEFELEDQPFSDRWMEKVVVKRKPRKAKAEQPEAE